MKYILLIAFIMLGTSVSAQITVDTSGDSVVYNFTGDNGTKLENNDFQGYLQSNGFNSLVSSAGLSVDSAGTFTFELLGGRTSSTSISTGNSTRTRSVTDLFAVNNQTIASVTGFENYTETNGIPLNLSVRIEEGGSISAGLFSFRSRQSTTTTTVSLNGRSSATVSRTGQPVSFFSQPFGIFVPGINTLTGLNSVIFAFEDNNSVFDFDDLLIRATFTADNLIASVPAPGGMIMLILALSFIFWRKRLALQN